MKHKIVIVLILLIGLILFIFIYQPRPIQEVTFEELTPDQINTLIKLRVIEVYPTLPEGSNDKYLEMVYRTPNGNCYLHQDIFGRFYCKW